MKKYLRVMLVLVVALAMFGTVAAANSFVISGEQTGGAVTNTVNNIGATVITIVQTVGYVVAVVMVLVVGIQWLIGTPAKKQELKGKMVNVVIGAILIVGGVTLLGMVEKFVNDTESSVETGAVEISETYLA